MLKLTQRKEWREGWTDEQKEREGSNCQELRSRSHLPPKTLNHSCSKRTEKIYDELSKELRKLFLIRVIISAEYSIGLVKCMVKARN